MPTYILIALTALVAATSLTPVATKIALHFGVVDYPGPRKVHHVPMPLLGGLAMYAGTILGVGLFAAEQDPATRAQIFGIMTAAGLLVLVGSLDDHRLLHHQIKLFVAMPAAALILIAAGLQASVFTISFGDASLWKAADLAATLLWVVGITEAFSILDHLDGLCAGVAAIATAFFLVFAVWSGQFLVAALAGAVLGASLGFLRWNFNPARIFMGDGGAMFLGFMMATLGLKLRIANVAEPHAALVPVLLLGVPIFDTTLVTISRTRRGLLPFASPGKDHTSHRLVGLGLTHKHAVVALYSAGATFGAAALVFARLAGPSAIWFGAGVITAAFVSILMLERCSYERQKRGVHGALRI